MNIYQKINELRAKCVIEKTGKNKFGNYEYYELNNIYAKTKPVCRELGITIIPFEESYDVAGNHVTKLSLNVYNADNPEEYVVVSATSEMSKLKGCVEAQSAGANITYLTKYCYGLLLNLDDGMSEPDSIEKFERDDIINKIKGEGEQFYTALLKYYKTKTIEELNDKQLKEIATKKKW